MIDPLGAEADGHHPDRGRRGVLALVTRPAQPRGGGLPVGGGERQRVDVELGGVHADADDPVGARRARPAQPDQLGHQLLPGLAAVGAVHVDDHPCLAACLGVAGRQARGQALEHGPEGLPRRQVPGRGDEDLRVDPAGGGTVQDRLVAEPFPVRLVVQDRLNEPENAEELIERPVAVQVADVAGRERQAVLAGQLDDGLRPHRALYMAVQFHLGQRPQCFEKRHLSRFGHGSHRSDASCPGRRAPSGRRSGLFVPAAAAPDGHDGLSCGVNGDHAPVRTSDFDLDFYLGGADAGTDR